MLKLKIQYFGHLIWRADSLEKTLMLGKNEGRRRRGWQRMRSWDDITDLMDMVLGGLRELVMDRKAWRAAVHCVAKSQTQLSNWTELNWWEGNRKEGWGSPNGGNRLQVLDIFYLSLKWQEEINYKCQIFFPSLYKIKRRFLLKFYVAMMTPGSTGT